MWLLHLIPDGLLQIIVNLILFIGIGLTLISIFVFDKIGRFIPIYARHSTLIRVISILILILGVYLKGGYNTEKVWRQRVAELEVKIKLAEEKSNVVNTVIEEKIVYKTKIVKEKAKIIIEKINNPVIIDYVENCPFPKEAIDIHNEAVDMNLIINEEIK